jgi:hypothetical protein
MPRKAELQGEINLNSTKLQRGLNQAQAKIKAFAASAAKSFGLAFAALGGAALTRGAIELGSRISDLAVQLRIGAEALQALQFAAKNAGVESSVLERALRNVQTRAQQAADGNKSYGEALNRLGINIKAFRNLRPEEQLEAIAIAQQKATDKTAAYNDVAIILGQRAGPEMQEVLKSLANEGFAGLTAAAKEAGQVMEDSTIKKLDEASDRISLLKNRVTILTGELLIKAIPTFGIFGELMGFVGKSVASAARLFISFGRAISDVMIGAAQPALSVLESLAQAALGAAAAIKGEFGLSKKLFIESKNAIAEVKDEVLAAPKIIEEAFNDIKTATSESFDDAQRAGLEALVNITKEVEKFKDKTEESVESVKDIGDEATKSASKVDSAFGGTNQIGKTKGGRVGKDEFDPLDFNKDGVVTGKERRRGEAEERKKESAQRRLKTSAVAAEATEGIRGRKAATAAEFAKREAAAGLSNTLSGRSPLGPTGSMFAAGIGPAGIGKKAAEGMKGKKQDQAKWQQAIIDMKDTINKLDVALSGE